MVYTVMAYIVMAYIVMASIVMAYIVMAYMTHHPAIGPRALCHCAANGAIADDDEASGSAARLHDRACQR